jgi:hypothetical protein
VVGLKAAELCRAMNGRHIGGHVAKSHPRAAPPELPLRRVTWVQPGSPGASNGPSQVVVAVRRGRSTELLRRAVIAGFNW